MVHNINCKKCEFYCIEHPLRKFFYEYGKFVSRNPWPFLIVPVIIAAVCSLGFIRKNVVIDALYLYTPTNSPSKHEQMMFGAQFPLKNGNFEPEKVFSDVRQSAVIAMASDGGNILRKDYGVAVQDLNQFVMNRVKVFHKGHEYTFQDLCLQTNHHDCFTNGGIPLVNLLYQNLPRNLTFPSVHIGSKLVYLASALGGVKLRPDSGIIDSAAAWYLIYQLQFEPENISMLSMMWEKEFQAAMANYDNPLLTTTYFHSQTLNEELVKNAEIIMPKFVVTFTVLIIFSIVCNTSFLSIWPPMIDWTVSKPFVALGGIINAGMGVSAAIGLLSWCGYHYNDIVAVVPFLVISICAEYMFLMIGAFRRTNRLHSVEERVGESISIHAVSIIIAMFTGGLSFAVGCITSIPAVEIFCAYACVSMMMTMFFQFTFFVAVLVLSGRLEESGRHSVFFMFKSVVPEKFAQANILQKIWFLGSKPDPTAGDDPKNFSTTLMDKFFEFWYAPILMHKAVKALVVLWLAVYLGFGIYGCLQLREGLRPVNLLVGDSYAIPHYEALEKYFWGYGPQVQILVNNAMNVSTQEGRDKAMEIVNAFANTPHTVGLEGVKFWLPDYLSYLKTFRYTDIVFKKPWIFYKALKDDFLALNTYEEWKSDVIWGKVRQDNTSNTTLDMITSYRFSVGMKDFVSTNDQVGTMQLMRKIAANYSEYNITTFMWFYLFADQYRLVLPNTLENVAIALVLMILVSIVLIPHPLCSVCVALAIVSIDVGVIGYMTLWGVNLDAVSMITIIMSIGFSVDFTAHISYGYVALSKDDENPIKKMQTVLGARSWPCLQAGLATIFGILALSDVEAYMINTFFKTVFLVMVIGLIHALVFLPVMLALLIEPLLGLVRPKGDQKEPGVTVISPVGIWPISPPEKSFAFGPPTIVPSGQSNLTGPHRGANGLDGDHSKPQPQQYQMNNAIVPTPLQLQPEQHRNFRKRNGKDNS